MNRPQLLWTSDDGDPQSFQLSSSEVVIGRKEKSDVVIRHPNASRLHAKIVEVQGGYELVDLDSKFGTFVNGKRVERYRLHVGDRIRIAEDAAELSYI